MKQTVETKFRDPFGLIHGSMYVSDNGRDIILTCVLKDAEHHIPERYANEIAEAVGMFVKEQKCKSY